MAAKKRKAGFWRQGEPFVWASGAALSFILFMMLLLFCAVLINGPPVFWASKLTRAKLKDGGLIMGQIYGKETIPSTGKPRLQFRIGNRDLYALDFKWVDQADIESTDTPVNAVVVERLEYGNFVGFLKELRGEEGCKINIPEKGCAWGRFQETLNSVQTEQKKLDSEKTAISRISREMEYIKREMAKLRHHGVAETAEGFIALKEQEKSLETSFQEAVQKTGKQTEELRGAVEVFTDVAGTEKAIPLADIVRVYRPNRMNVADKSWLYIKKTWELLSAEPRESNTEGGLFPAIFGTVMMIFLMSILSFPLGVVAGIYLREYAKDGMLVRMVRIAVNNLSGIPSIVYGIFGLGFFVYGLGSTIDQLFFAERLPQPTFGTGGILWASLTLGLLTVPVVIVATEEALGAIPKGIREASLALGATKFQTLVKLLLPMASPGIMTGFVLAMARAAGEVAPLMITGVVKLAPALPIDGQFPYFHLDRKFMHLGFHIYDIGFQSPNVEAAKPMVYVTTLLLLAIVVLMSSAAITMRNKMKKRYSLKEV